MQVCSPSTGLARQQSARVHSTSAGLEVLFEFAAHVGPPPARWAGLHRRIGPRFLILPPGSTRRKRPPPAPVVPVASHVEPAGVRLQDGRQRREGFGMGMTERHRPQGAVRPRHLGRRLQPGRIDPGACWRSERRPTALAGSWGRRGRDPSYRRGACDSNQGSDSSAPDT